MLYVISGAAASGKSTISEAVANRVPNLELLEEDHRHAGSGERRLANLELWIADALELEAQGRDAIYAAQSPLGEVLASPSAVKLDGIAPCLLDAHDSVRMERWMARGVHPDWPIGMDHFCWAVFHRLHARDPQFEQRVLLDRNYDASIWSRWTGWTADDPRWDVYVCDSTAMDVDATIDTVTHWVRSVRENGAPLRRKDEWWAPR